MKLIRSNIFETNSSSTHSLVMCMADDYEAWKNGKAYYIEASNEILKPGKELDDYCKKQIIYDKAEYHREGDKYLYFYGNRDYEERSDMYTEENLAAITREDIDKYLKRSNRDSYDSPQTYKEYWDQVEESCYESFEDSITTPSDDKVVVFGYYGNDY